MIDTGLASTSQTPHSDVVPSCNNISMSLHITVIILFIGHQTFYGNASLGGGLFPSGFPNLGSLVFHNGNHQSRDDLSSFLNVQFGKCLFITQSSYSGGILQHVAKGKIDVLQRYRACNSKNNVHSQCLI